MRVVAKYLDKLSMNLNRVAIFFATLAILVMAFSAGYQVVARYIFHSPPAWTEEVARYAMIWSGLLGASIAFREVADPSLFPQMRLARGKLGVFLSLFRMSGVLVFITPILYFSLFGPNQNLLRGFLMRNFDKTAEVTGVSMIYVVSAVPLVCALILVHQLSELITILVAEIRKKHQGEST